MKEAVLIGQVLMMEKEICLWASRLPARSITHFLQKQTGFLKNLS